MIAMTIRSSMRVKPDRIRFFEKLGKRISSCRIRANMSRFMKASTDSKKAATEQIPDRGFVSRKSAP
jgi:hypothetical protein